MSTFIIELYNRNYARVTNRFFNLILNFMRYWIKESINACAWDRTTWRKWSQRMLSSLRYVDKSSIYRPVFINHSYI